MPGATQSIIINVPPKVIYDVVLDFESYPEFFKDVKSITVEKKKPLTVTFEINVIKKIKYTLVFNTTPNKKVFWSFVEGDVFKENKGSWIFEEEGKDKTHVTYNIEVDFGLFVPSLITNKLIGRNLPDMLQTFKKRAEEIYEG